MSRDNPRARRMGEQIQRELTDVLRRGVKDSRIGNVTITAVDVSGDLRTAKVFYLIFELDTSIERGVRLTQLIDAANKPAGGGDPGTGGDPGAGGDAGAGGDPRTGGGRGEAD